ncbi:hypothetical protein C2G38_2194396 [Gigaspora rosea]|uniref:Uncharacterized protein n=1 Tax=Gigaspora rosea TaxID=44941 RepID=A0A397V0Z0_9GLOM|nr:hypothetical protein C2G38_2194396 [Gigaspora rosea]
MIYNSNVKIPIEEAPDKNKILEIVCSPNMKHAATLDEVSNISFWPTINQEQLLEKVKTDRIDNIRINENIGAVHLSLLKLVTMKNYYLYAQRIRKLKKQAYSLFSTETEINISSFTTNLVIDRLHLIASEQGERLPYRCINNSGKYNFNLMDPVFKIQCSHGSQ